MKGRISIRFILRHNSKRFLALAFVLGLLTQGCAKVEFSTVNKESTYADDYAAEEPEYFELSSSGMFEQPDDNGATVFLSGTVGSSAAMGPATDDLGQTLFTGFYSIHSSFR